MGGIILQAVFGWVALYYKLYLISGTVLQAVFGWVAFYCKLYLVSGTVIQAVSGQVCTGGESDCVSVSIIVVVHHCVSD